MGYYYAHEAFEEDWGPVIEAAQHGDMAEVAKLVADGDIYRKDELRLRDAEVVTLRRQLRARWLGIFSEGPEDTWWMIGAIRECPTCGAEVLADEQCDTCIGPKPAVVS